MIDSPPGGDSEPGRCARHFSHPAILSCIDCGDGLCRQCIYRGVDGFARCPDCARPTDVLDESPDPDMPVTPTRSAPGEQSLGMPPGTAETVDSAHAPTEGIPWEMREGGDFRAFLSTVTQAITQPQRFMQKIDYSYTHYREVYTFGIIMVTLAQFVATLSLLGNSGQFEDMAKMMGLPNTTPVHTIVFMSLPFLPIAALLIVLLKSGLAHLMAVIVLNTERGLGPTLKIIAYAEAASILFLIPFIGPYAYTFLFVFLVIMGVKSAYGATIGQAVLVVLPTLFLSL